MMPPARDGGGDDDDHDHDGDDDAAVVSTSAAPHPPTCTHLRSTTRHQWKQEIEEKLKMLKSGLKFGTGLTFQGARACEGGGLGWVAPLTTKLGGTCQQSGGYTPGTATA